MGVPKQEIIDIAVAFGISGEVVSYEKINNGNVNETYKVKLYDKSVRLYIFQKLNKVAFRNLKAVMENVSYVTSKLREYSVFPSVLKCYQTGESLIYDVGENSWRVFDYIEGETYNGSDEATIVRETGAAFGKFQKALWQSDKKSLIDTIPDFHNTSKRYEALYKAYEADLYNRKESAAAELKLLKSMEQKACILAKLQQEEKLPVRIVHNDTKINNVIFDASKKAIAVIDLDTVMPGLAAYDFGDGVRFAADGRRCGDTEIFSIGCFKQFTEGFLQEIGASLEQVESETLYLAPFAMTVELAARYLTDFLEGDKYFSVKEKNQNLVKCRKMIELALDMQKKEKEIKEIINSICMQERA